MNGALKPYLVLTNDAAKAGYLYGYTVFSSANIGQAIAAGCSTTIERREYMALSVAGSNENNLVYTDASDGTIVDGVTAYRSGYNLYGWWSGVESIANPYPSGTPDYDLWALGSTDASSDFGNSKPNMYTGDSTAWLGVTADQFMTYITNFGLSLTDMTSRFAYFLIATVQGGVQLGLLGGSPRYIDEFGLSPYTADNLAAVFSHADPTTGAVVTAGGGNPNFKR